MVVGQARSVGIRSDFDAEVTSPNLAGANHPAVARAGVRSARLPAEPHPR